MIYKADLVLAVLAAAGFVFAAVRKDFFLLLWAIPFVLFFSIIGHMPIYYWAPLLPVFCIASASLIANLTSSRISKKKWFQKILLPFAVILGIGVFGLVNTAILITVNLNSSYFKAAAFTTRYIQNISKDAVKNNNDNNDDIIIILGSTYSWIFRYVFDEKHVFRNLYDSQLIQTKNVIVIADGSYKDLLNQREDYWIDKRLQMVYSNTTTIATFKGKKLNYDYSEYLNTNIKYAKRWSESSIDIRTSYY